MEIRWTRPFDVGVRGGGGGGRREITSLHLSLGFGQICQKRAEAQASAFKLVVLHACSCRLCHNVRSLRPTLEKHRKAWKSMGKQVFARQIT